MKRFFKRFCFDSVDDVVLDLTSEELALICRALSDSMNYHPDVSFREKWVLLLKLKDYELKLREDPDHE